MDFSEDPLLKSVIEDTDNKCFDKEQEKIVWGIPDADYEEQRQEKRKILHAQNVKLAEAAMKEAMDNGETIDPGDYEVGDASAQCFCRSSLWDGCCF